MISKVYDPETNRCRHIVPTDDVEKLAEMAKDWGIANPVYWTKEEYKETQHSKDIEAQIAYREEKSLRLDNVSKLIVEVDGMVFDGDEVSRNRMTSAVVASIDNEETTEWILADNTVKTVTAGQLKAALRLVGQETTTILIPE